MIYVALILLATCIVLGFFLYVALVGHAEQTTDLLEEREELLAVIRRLRMGNHPAGRALSSVPDFDRKALALAEALTERDAEHEGGGGA